MTSASSTHHPLETNENLNRIPHQLKNYLFIPVSSLIFGKAAFIKFYLPRAPFHRVGGQPDERNLSVSTPRSSAAVILFCVAKDVDGENFLGSRLDIINFSIQISFVK